MQVPKILFVALVAHVFLESVSAAKSTTLKVFTDIDLWKAEVKLATGPPCLLEDNFDGIDIPLKQGGTTDVGLFDVTAKPFEGIKTGKIDNKLVLQYGFLGSTILKFRNFDNEPIVAFAAEWKSTSSFPDYGGLTVKINGNKIKFTEELPSGTGFLGFVDATVGITTLSFGIEDDPTLVVGGIKINLGAERFSLDNAIAAGKCPDGGAGTEGDPHFKTWRGQRFDYHGECDLVLLHSAAFESGLGLDVHIRTKIRRDMSYIASAALKIGEDLLEVESQGVYRFNGVLSAELPAEFSGFAFSHTQPTEKQHVFEVYLGGRERIKLKTYKDFVSVLIEQGKSEHFMNSVGLMGDFAMGRMIARDGKTVIDDANAFGQEWQVRDTESSLFHTVRLPQHPKQVCTLPTPKQASQLRRRLLETSPVDELAAEKACEHWGEGKDDCVFDVLTTGDLEMAVVGAY
jgi:hypothetical protein